MVSLNYVKMSTSFIFEMMNIIMERVIAWEGRKQGILLLFGGKENQLKEKWNRYETSLSSH